MFGPPRQKTFRDAVAKMLRDVMSKHDLKPVELAEEIGACKDALDNWLAGENDMKAVTLLRIAYEFGEDAIAPVRELYLCRHVAPPTVEDHAKAIRHHLDAIERESGA